VDCRLYHYGCAASGAAFAASRSVYRSTASLRSAALQPHSWHRRHDLKEFTPPPPEPSGTSQMISVVHSADDRVAGLFETHHRRREQVARHGLHAFSTRVPYNALLSAPPASGVVP